VATIAIDMRGVSKAFVLRRNRADSLKLRVLGTANRRYREHRQLLWALKDINLTLFEGDTVGLIGPNGSGKSTLLRLVAGILFPSRGEIRLKGSVASLLELGVGFHPELTGRENVYLNTSLYGLSRRETDRLFEAIWDFSELCDFMDLPVKNYSSGMYCRLAFSVAVHLDADILLLDEILAVGDERFQLKCLERMQALNATGKTIVFVSHNLDAVGMLCNRACLLWGGQVMSEGSPPEVAAHYRELLNAPLEVMPAGK
jgi:ABC-2 type transport system ATP-binding protein